MGYTPPLWPQKTNINRETTALRLGKPTDGDLQACLANSTTRVPSNLMQVKLWFALPSRDSFSVLISYKQLERVLRVTISL